MHPAVRIGLVVLGAAMAVYGAASLTGGWLGTPPWWEKAAPITAAEWARRYRPDLELPFWGTGTQGAIHRYNLSLLRDDAARHVEPRDGRGWISGGGVAMGLALVAVGAWPRRRDAKPADAATTSPAGTPAS